MSANGTVTVTAKVKNTGTKVASTVPQLYVTTPFEPASAQRPIKRLEGFQRVTLNPGQTKTVTFHVKAADPGLLRRDGEQVRARPGHVRARRSAHRARTPTSRCGARSRSRARSPRRRPSSPPSRSRPATRRPGGAAGDVRHQHDHRPAADRVDDRPAALRLRDQGPVDAAARRADGQLRVRPAGRGQGRPGRQLAHRRQRYRHGHRDGPLPRRRRRRRRFTVDVAPLQIHVGPDHRVPGRRAGQLHGDDELCRRRRS